MEQDTRILLNAVSVGSSFFGDQWTLITDSQDVNATLDHLGTAIKDNAESAGYRGLYVLAEDGDIVAVYGFVGNVAYTYKTAYRLFPATLD